MTNAGELQIASGDSRWGWYLQGGGQYITGVHVPTNSRFDGTAGAYWGVLSRPDYGNLTIGMNFFGMHYAQNLRYFTYGQGGYFSPDAYVVASVPVSFNGHYGPKFHYKVVGSIGIQAFNEETSPYFPLDTAIQAAQGNPYYPAMTSVGGNYNFESEASYAIADHWYVGGYANFNNSRDYASEKAGFFVRYLFRPQPMIETGPTGLFPVQGLRPFQVP
jgi:cellulose synthase operon protein C